MSLLTVRFVANYITMAETIECKFHLILQLGSIKGIYENKQLVLNNLNLAQSFQWLVSLTGESLGESLVRSEECEDIGLVSLLFKTEFCNGTQGKIHVSFSSAMNEPVLLVIFWNS